MWKYVIIAGLLTTPAAAHTRVVVIPPPDAVRVVPPGAALAARSIDFYDGQEAVSPWTGEGPDVDDGPAHVVPPTHWPPAYPDEDR